MGMRAMMKAPSKTGLELRGTCVDYDGLSGMGVISLSRRVHIQRPIMYTDRIEIHIVHS